MRRSSARFGAIPVGARLLLIGRAVVHRAPHVRAQVSCPGDPIWADEFEGTSLDPNKWEAMIGNGCQEGICGWGNGELQYYKAENAAVSGGTLKIEAKSERVKNKAYTSARIRTKNLGGEFLHGRFEARIKIPTGKGLWPAFWMLPTNGILGGWPVSGEIDIMENIGSEPSVAHGTIHYTGPQNTGKSVYLPNGDAFHDDFHDFAIEKEEGVIRWLLDGAEYSVKTPEDTGGVWPFDQPGEVFHFLLNVAVGGNWPGSPDSTTMFPQTMEVDYVRVYDGTTPSFGRLVGPLKAQSCQLGVEYSLVEGIADYAYAWSVPDGASITEDLGSSIKVDFGTASGYIRVTATSGTCTEGGSSDPLVRTFSLPVNVDPTYVFDGHFIAPDATTDQLAGPDPDPATGIYLTATDSSKGNVIQYLRNINEQYDVIAYRTSHIDPAAALEYASGARKFLMDVRSPDAPPCTEILVQLEDSSAATASNYPAGRHSRYAARLPADGSAAGEWKRLGFDFVDRPDHGTTMVDTIILLFDPNKYRGDVYYFDNFDGGASAAASSCGDPNVEVYEAATCPSAAKTEAGSSTCGDGIDNDSDGTIDCADPNCADDPTYCPAGPPPSPPAPTAGPPPPPPPPPPAPTAGPPPPPPPPPPAPTAECVPSGGKPGGNRCNNGNKGLCCNNDCTGSGQNSVCL